MKKQMSLLACLVFAATAAVAQTDANTVAQTKQAELSAWKRYTVNGERFSVSLPTVPAMTTQSMVIWELRKSRRYRELGVYADGGVYCVSVYENVTRQSLGDFIVEQSSRRNYWDLSTEQTVTVGDVAGKQYSSADTAQRRTAQFFATEGRLYMFSAHGNQADDQAVKQFFSSIVFGKKAEGIEVNDGEGKPFSSPTCEEVAQGKQVGTKVRLVMKPEPRYTESARQRQVVGTVILKAVFSCNGSVEQIRAVKELPEGLTEQAIAAARKIKYIPAVKDGKFASMWMQLEYNFNLY
ncbi:MAG TPA: energy transducer TonB [Pyrinomonadaceae bacterium]|nr:energy transducer TonB [Pyrinomonadaceae bacterium]